MLGGWSDFASFHAERIPYVHFSSGVHADYHKSTDTVDHIQPAFYVRAVDTITEFVRRLDLALDRVVRAR